MQMILMTDSNDRSDSAFPNWLRDTRPNWVATGAVLLTVGLWTYNPADDLTGMILSLTCGGLALACFTAAAIDGPHIQTQTCTCRGLCLCQVGHLFSRAWTTIAQWGSRSSTERNHSTNAP
jgi:hypothetical protein